MKTIDMEKAITQALSECLDEDLQKIYETEKGKTWGAALAEVQNLRNQKRLIELLTPPIQPKIDLGSEGTGGAG